MSKYFDLSSNIKKYFGLGLWILFIVTNFKIWVYKKKKCLVIHIVLFIVANFKIWVYKENMWIKRHIVLFIVTNFKIWVYKENVWLVIHIILLKKVKIN